MNKQEAAQFLGVSVRALERYVQQRRVSVRYEKGKTRTTAKFDPTELESLREQIHQPVVKPAVETRQIATVPEPQADRLVHHPGEVSEFVVVERLAAIIEGLLESESPAASVADKPLLTIAESQLLTGLSREFIREAISTGQLKAKVIGRSWRIKRCDLDEWVERLF